MEAFILFDTYSSKLCFPGKPGSPGYAKLVAMAQTPEVFQRFLANWADFAHDVEKRLSLQHDGSTLIAGCALAGGDDARD